MLSSKERDRLVALLGMLGSDHDGERANSGSLLTRFVRQRGLTWDQIIPRVLAAPEREPTQPPPEPPRPERPRATHDMHWLAAVEHCLSTSTPLRGKDRVFLIGLLQKRPRPPSVLQEHWLRDILDRVIAAEAGTP